MGSLQGMLQLVQLFMDIYSSDLPGGHGALEFADFTGCVDSHISV